VRAATPSADLRHLEGIMGTTVTFKQPDGKEASGYLAKAARANAPSVVVIQEWWGVQDQIKGICDRFAAAGYEALAPDLYAGTVVPYHDTDAANREMNSLNFIDATDQVARGAAQFLKITATNVGLTGFCLGGVVAVLGAARIPEFTAAVCFYGLPPADMVNLANIHIPLQGHFANQDDWCTPKLVNEFKFALKRAGKSADIFCYEAKHGFMNEQCVDTYDRRAAELAWERTISFWQRHL
jgi:carboxymethylenebutenolidase